jgi:hypothetical protein
VTYDDPHAAERQARREAEIYGDATLQPRARRSNPAPIRAAQRQASRPPEPEYDGIQTYDPPEAERFVPGQPVEWLHEPRGGYGYQTWVLARILKLGPKKVFISPQRENGTDGPPRWVTPERLRPRGR